MHDVGGETDQALTHRLGEGQHPQGRVLVLPQDLELLRCVSNAGTFHFQKRQLFISDTPLQEDIALEETGNGIWPIYFYNVLNVLLARLDERDFRLYA